VYFKSQREYRWEACAQTKGLIKTVRATGILLDLSFLCCDECEVFVRAHTPKSPAFISPVPFATLIWFRDWDAGTIRTYLTSVQESAFTKATASGMRALCFCMINCVIVKACSWR